MDEHVDVEVGWSGVFIVEGVERAGARKSGVMKRGESRTLSNTFNLACDYSTSPQNRNRHF